MNKPTRKQISEQIGTRLYFRWQAQRRNDDYRKAVAIVLREVRRTIRTIVQHDWKQLKIAGRGWPHRDISNDYITILMKCREQGKACLSILDAYKRIKSLIRQFDAALTPATRHDLENMQGAKYAEISHAIMNLIAPCLSEEMLNHIPALERFQQQWDIRFPLAPGISWVIGEAFISSKTVPVRVTNVDDTNHTVHLAIQLDTDLPKEIIMAFVDTQLSRYLPKERTRWRVASKTRARSRKHYQDAFCTYDLRQQGLSIDEIAKRVWPDDFEKQKRDWPGKNPVSQRVHDHIKLAQELIHAAKK